jgi:hypothetical protein
MTGSSVYSNMNPSCFPTEVKIKIQLTEINSERRSPETDSESCPLAGFGIKDVEASGSATGSYLISNTYITELSFQDGRWIQLAQDTLQLRDLVLKVLNLQVLVQKLWYVS